MEDGLAKIARIYDVSSPPPQLLALRHPWSNTSLSSLPLLSLRPTIYTHACSITHPTMATQCLSARTLRESHRAPC